MTRKNFFPVSIVLAVLSVALFCIDPMAIIAGGW